MRLGEIISLAARQNGLPAQRRQDAAPAPEGRALVALTPATAPSEPCSYRQAAFLAHLIATKEQLPQTRERRRAGLSEAIAAYRTAANLAEQHSTSF